MLSEVEQEQRPSGNGDREAIVVGAGLCDGEGERAYTEYAPTLEGESTENLLPKRLSPAVKTFRHQRRFGNKKLPKRLPPSCCRNVLCRNVRNPRPDGVAMIPWEMGKQLVGDVTVVDALAPSRLNQGSLCNPGTTATEAEARKIEKYRELIDNGYIFQPVALEVQGSIGESSEISSRVSVNCSVVPTTINELAAF